MNSHIKMILPPAPWTKALEDGSVKVPGLTWEAMTGIDGAPERFVATHGEDIDVGENGLRRYIIDLLKGAPRLAIPAFFGREHMQRNLLVRDDGSVTHPHDLLGKKIGSRLSVSSGTGAAVLMMLEQGYNLPLGELIFCMGNPDQLRNNRIGLQVKHGPGSDKEGFELLLKGKLDALILTSGPRYFSMFGHDRLDKAVTAQPRVRVLVNDPSMIAETYRRSGLYPISDLVVLGAKAVATDPEVPAKVMAALTEANKQSSNYRDQEEERLARDEISLLGTDPHEYTLGPEQRKNIAAYTDFFYRMGAIEKYVEPEEIFLN